MERRASDEAGKVLAAAVREVMPSLNYYIGPNARTAVGRDSIAKYYAISHALARAEGKPCPRCGDTGIDKQTSHCGPVRCALAALPLHPAPEPEERAQIDAYARERAQRRRARELTETEESDG